MDRGRLRHAFLAIPALAAVALACQTVMSLVPGGMVPLASTLFYDDFSDPTTGWDRRTYDGGATDYVDGQYQILVTEPESDYWANPGLSFDDVRLETTATKAGGPDDNDFGVICRYLDTGNFYYFVISSDGFGGILKVKSQVTTPLVAGGMLASDAIHQGNAANSLAAECIGSTLRLFVNEQLVAEAEDPDFASGDVGLIAGTFDIPGTDVRFDDFRVLEP